MNELSARQQQTYDAAKNYMQINGGSITSAVKSTGGQLSTFYAALKALRTTAKEFKAEATLAPKRGSYKKRKPAMHTLIVDEVEDETPPTDQVICIIGNSRSVVATVKEYLRS